MPNRDNAPVLDHVLDRLAVNTDYPDAELIVVDDGSTDGGQEIVKRRGNRLGSLDLRLIEREHSGVVDTLNAGLAEAGGELVVQLDGDATVETPGWLGEMVSFLASDERIGVVTGRVVFDWGELHACGVSVVGPAGLHDRGTEPAEPVGRRTWHGAVRRPREDAAPCRELAEVDAGLGCCMMYRRDVALELGGYDPGFAPVWFDDVDLALSMRRRGLKAFFHPGVRVVHHIGERNRHALPIWKRAVGALRWRAALNPVSARLLAAPRASREHGERLAGHYDYWAQKWGFDILNPDMPAVRERWGDTEVCWQTNPAMREAGEQIVEAYRA